MSDFLNKLAAGHAKGANDTAPKEVPNPSETPNSSPVEPPKASGGITQFVDLSRYQPNVNYDNLVKAGFQAIVAKATDGQASEDAMFDKHGDNAKRLGLPFGGYCFNRFSADPVKQADFFAKTVEKRTRWIIADIEWDRSKTTEAKFGKRYGEGKTMDPYAADHALKFLERLEALGFKPWIYSNTYFFLGFKNPERFARFPYWASNYTQKTKAVKDLDVSKVPLPKPFKKPIAWQWTDKFHAAKSITGDAGLDANLYFGSIEELRKLAQ
jgi:GH25 family lysozyme M1 (1,4-beta-N-acetylmuramidase)